MAAPRASSATVQPGRLGAQRGHPDCWGGWPRATQGQAEACPHLYPHVHSHTCVSTLTRTHLHPCVPRCSHLYSHSHMHTKVSPCDLPSRGTNSSLWLELLGMGGGPKNLGVGTPAGPGKWGRPPHSRPQEQRLLLPQPSLTEPVNDQGLGEDHCQGAPGQA